jgi:hypothetical protein
MQVITVELLNENALKLLQQLEQMKIIKLSLKPVTPAAPKKKWAGTLSKETAANMLQHLEYTRNEWERI